MSLAPFITGTASCLPAREVTSAELDVRLGQPHGWLEAACGVAVRRHAVPEETQIAMAVTASRRALETAGMDTGALDLILFAAAVGYQPIPATAPLIKRELGGAPSTCPAYDVNATCLGALVALDLACLYIQAGRARNVLVVASEIASRALPWADAPATAGLFGDGAAAIIVSEKSKSSGLRLGHFAMETWEEGYDCCTLAAGGTRFDFNTDRANFEANALFRMDGHRLFKLTRHRISGFVGGLLARAGWRPSDVDLVIPHQASPLALQHMARSCGFVPDQVFDTVRDTGNLVAASLPTTLDSALRSGRIKPGARLLMIGTSAGVSVAGATLTA